MALTFLGALFIIVAIILVFTFFQSRSNRSNYLSCEFCDRNFKTKRALHLHEEACSKRGRARVKPHEALAMMVGFAGLVIIIIIIILLIVVGNIFS